MAELFLRSGGLWTGVVHGSAEKPWCTVARKCGRCGGGRILPQFKHVEAGVCFGCGGTGMGEPKEEKLFTAEKLAKLNATAAKKAEKKAAAAAIARAASEAKAASQKEAFEAEFAEELAWLASVALDQNGDVKTGFCGDMLLKARHFCAWTEAQAAAVKAALAKAKAQAVIAAASQFVGSVGERIEAVVTVERETSFLRQGWGFAGMEEVWVTTMRTADGNALVVMSPRFREEVGSTLKIKGTVKELKEFRGEKQTVLARVTSKAMESA